MRASVTYKKPKFRPTKSKSSRIAKMASAADLSNCGAVVIKGYINHDTPKEFYFNIVSPTQQMRERNKAYSFFSID